MKIKVPPCKDCERRNESCHAKCEDYKEWQIEHEKYKVQKRIYDEQASRYQWSEGSEKFFAKKIKKNQKKLK